MSHDYRPVSIKINDRFHIAAQIEPKISDVVNEIADVVNWERLGLMLGLSIADMDKIRNQYHPNEHHQRLAELWHSRGNEYSWSKLLRELDKLYPRRKSSVSVSSPPPESSGKSIPSSSMVRLIGYFFYRS